MIDLTTAERLVNYLRLIDESWGVDESVEIFGHLIAFSMELEDEATLKKFFSECLGTRKVILVNAFTDGSVALHYFTDEDVAALAATMGCDIPYSGLITLLRKTAPHMADDVLAEISKSKL